MTKKRVALDLNVDFLDKLELGDKSRKATLEEMLMEVSSGNSDGFTRIDPAHIDPNPFQPRISMDEDELLKLADNIHAHGLLQKIMVRPKGDRFEAAFGHRRLEAWRLLKQKHGGSYETMPCTVRELSDAEMYKFAATENGQREELSIMEIARSIVQAKELGITQQEAAAAHGRSKGNASTLVKFVDLSFPVQDMLHDGRLGFGHGRELVRMLENFEAEIIEKMATDAMERNYKVSHLKTNVDNAIDRRKKETTFHELHCPLCCQKQNVSEYDIEFYSVITCEACESLVNARKFLTAEEQAQKESQQPPAAAQQPADSPQEAHEADSTETESDGWIQMRGYWRCDFCREKTLQRMKWVDGKRWCEKCVENESVTLWCRGCFQARTFTEPLGRFEKCGTCGRNDLAEDWFRNEPDNEEIEAIEAERLRYEIDQLTLEIYKLPNEQLASVIEAVRAAIVAQQQ